MRNIEEFRARLLSRLSSCVLTPGMMVCCEGDQELGYRGLLNDLCFIDERESAFEEEFERLSRVGARYPANLVGGVTNSLRLVMPDVQDFSNETASVWAEVAFRLGYLDVARTLASSELDKAHAHFDEGPFARDWSEPEIVQAFGAASLRIGAGKERAGVLCFASSEPGAAWLFIDLTMDHRVRSIRRYDKSLEDGLRLTPYGRTLTRRGEARPALVLGPEWRRAQIKLVDRRSDSDE